LHPALVSRIKVMAELDITERRIPQDGRIRFAVDGRQVDLRVSTLPTLFGEKVVLRILDRGRAITDLAALGFPEEELRMYRELIRRPYGMILVTGPTGSGKTTTLVATLHEINDPSLNILTVEDPVEYQVPGVNQVQVNPKAGLHFADALRAFLRQDPNVIMVGEVRDAETAEIAIRAALTGHLVFSTLHTNNAAGAITRLLDMGVEPYLVASSVMAAVSQRLARTLCPECREAYTLPEDARERLLVDLPPGPVTLYRPRGCSACHRTGYRGRTALMELLVVDADLRQLIVGRASAGELHQAAVAKGMRPLLHNGVLHALSGRTSLDEVLRVAYTGE
ncbi:MAG: type II/IV secretion system protein, partial [Clostridia bacterium]|nr:type II/IV secretion system protein [Clostridia bacterium]